LLRVSENVLWVKYTLYYDTCQIFIEEKGFFSFFLARWLSV